MYNVRIALLGLTGVLANPLFADGFESWHGSGGDFMVLITEQVGRKVARLSYPRREADGYPCFVRTIPVKPGRAFEFSFTALPEAGAIDGIVYGAVSFLDAGGKVLSFMQTDFLFK